MSALRSLIRSTLVRNVKGHDPRYPYANAWKKASIGALIATPILVGTEPGRRVLGNLKSYATEGSPYPEGLATATGALIGFRSGRKLLRNSGRLAGKAAAVAGAGLGGLAGHQLEPDTPVKRRK